MKLTPIKLSILTFTFLFLKKILFPEWEFQKVDYNSLELIVMVFALGFSFYSWIKVSTKNIALKKATGILSLLLCTIFIYQKFPTKNETIDKIEISENEEILIEQLDRSYCIGDQDYCIDSIKVTKYNIFQKRKSIKS
jgi:hypothetical protein